MAYMPIKYEPVSYCAGVRCRRTKPVEQRNTDSSKFTELPSLLGEL